MIACWTVYHGSNWQAGHRLIISPAELMRMWPISTRVNKPESGRVVDAEGYGVKADG